jgi:hypothetical protein
VLLALFAAASIVSGIARMVSEHRVRLFGVCGGLALLLTAALVCSMAGWAQTYHGLGSNQIVATVHSELVPGAPNTMQVVFTPVVNGKAGRAQVFTVKGDEWQLRGEVVTWQDWLNILGLRANYRFTGLSGYYEDTSDSTSSPATAYDLSSAHDAVNRLVHDHPGLMPLARLTSSSVRMLPGPATYQIYISSAGYWAAQS